MCLGTLNCIKGSSAIKSWYNTGWNEVKQAMFKVLRFKILYEF
jgi:hypothetical protein